MAWFQTVRGAEIYYADTGPLGAAPVVLVHGASQHCGVWHNQVPLLLDAGLRCVMLDLPGHGRSSALPDPADDRTAAYDIGGYASALRELLAAVLAEPAILVGHSMSSGVVLQVALDAPSAVLGGVVMDGTSYSTGYPERVLQAVSLNVPGWLEVNYRALCSRSTAKERIDEAVLSLHDTNVRTMWNDMIAFSGLDLRPRLAELRMPIGFVHGSEDWSVSVEMAQATRSLCVNAPTRMEVIDRVGHFPHIEDPDRLCPVLIDVVRWVTRTARRADTDAPHERSV